MNNFPYSSGDSAGIQNKEFARIKTDKTKDIVCALDLSHIPHFASFSDKEISLVYNKHFKGKVDEIVSKATSDDYDYIVRELKESREPEKLLVLLPEISKIMGVTVGYLEDKPVDMQLQLCKKYVDLWVCDSETIYRELMDIYDLKGKTLEEVQAEDPFYKQNSDKEKNSNSAEKAQKQAVAEAEQRKAIQGAYISREATHRLAEQIRRKNSEEKRKQQSIEQEERNKNK